MVTVVQTNADLRQRAWDAAAQVVDREPMEAGNRRHFNGT